MAPKILVVDDDADLRYLGRWSDGRPVRAAIVSDHPVDAGPPAVAFNAYGLRGECESPHNPRASRCPASRACSWGLTS